MVEVPFDGIHRGRFVGAEVDKVRPYSAIVYKEGDWVIAENWKGKKIAEGVSGVDDAQVIQSAYSYILSSGGGKIVLVSDLILLSQVNLESSTYHYFILDGNGYKISGKGINITLSTWRHIRGEIRNLQFETDAGSYSLYLQVPQHFRIVNCYFNGGLGIKIDNARGLGIYDTIVSSMTPTTGEGAITIQGRDTAADKSTHVRIKNTSVTSNSGYGICIKDNSVVFLDTVHFEGNSNYDIYSESAHLITANKLRFYTAKAFDVTAERVFIQNSWIQQTTENRCYIRSSQYVKIVGNHFQKTPLTLTNCAEYNITKNTFRDLTTTTILEVDAGGSIEDNIFRGGGTKPSIYAIDVVANLWDNAKVIVKANRFNNFTGTLVNAIDSEDVVAIDNIAYNIGTPTNGHGFVATLKGINIVNNLYTQNSDTATITADGATTQFTIPHGLVSTPNFVQVTPKAGAPTPDSIDADATNIILTFSTAPAAGTYYYWWKAEV